MVLAIKGLLLLLQRTSSHRVRSQVDHKQGGLWGDASDANEEDGQSSVDVDQFREGLQMLGKERPVAACWGRRHCFASRFHGTTSLYCSGSQRGDPDAPIKSYSRHFIERDGSSTGAKRVPNPSSKRPSAPKSTGSKQNVPWSPRSSIPAECPQESQAIGLVNILKRIVQVISNRDVKILRRY